MGKIMILNASPRAPRSHSKAYADIFSKYSKQETEYFIVSSPYYERIFAQIEQVSDVLLVFPLYADGIPVPLLKFLKELQQRSFQKKPVISVLINCGFFEPGQNDIAVEMVKIFCRQNGYVFGSVLKIGSGEAILTTPFVWFVKRNIKKLAQSIHKQRYQTLQTTMPISVKMFVRASTRYWLNCGEKNGVTEEQMQTMQIED